MGHVLFIGVIGASFMLEVINFGGHSTFAYCRGKYIFICNNCVCLQQPFCVPNSI